MYGDRQTHYFSVALIKRNSLSDVRALTDLKGKKACFAAVGTLAGWFIPINTVSMRIFKYVVCKNLSLKCLQLMKHGGMSVYDCNNHIKSATNYFGDSCAVNSLINRYNPIGDNSEKLCKICGGSTAWQKCTVHDPYYGYHGAVQCLMDKGEIAFVKHTALECLENPHGYQLLCKDGSRQLVSEYTKCNWGRVPTDAIVTTTAKSVEDRQSYQKFFKVSFLSWFWTRLFHFI